MSSGSSPCFLLAFILKKIPFFGSRVMRFRSQICRIKLQRLLFFRLVQSEALFAACVFAVNLGIERRVRPTGHYWKPKRDAAATPVEAFFLFLCLSCFLCVLPSFGRSVRPSIRPSSIEKLSTWSHTHTHTSSFVREAPPVMAETWAGTPFCKWRKWDIWR